MAAALLLALAIDYVFGEPPAAWHPVVWMRRGLDWAAARFVPSVDPADKAQNFMNFWLGAAYWSAQAAIIFVVTYLLVHALATLPLMLAAALVALFLKPMLAWRMLREKVMAVQAELAQSVEAARAPGVYVLNATGRDAVSSGIFSAVKLASNTVLTQVITAQAAIFLIAL